MFEWIVSSSVLIGAVLLLRKVLGSRISLRLRYGLWALVLVRLLVPINLFDSALSVLNLSEKALEQSAVREFRSVVSAPIPVQSYESARAEVLAEYEARGIPVSGETEGDSNFETQVYEAQDNVTLTEVLHGLWLAGMAATGGIMVLCNLHFIRRLRRSRKLREDVCCLLPIYESGAVMTPCLYGVFRPAIYLTPAVAETAEARGHVLAHELTHYRHLDHIWAVLRSLCLVLHWYNPLVWLAFRVSREDAELACDEGALEALGEGARAEYGETLIRLTCGEGLSTGLVAATTMTGTKSSIARRLKALMKARETTYLALTALILAGAVAVGCTFSGAPETGEPGIDINIGEDDEIICTLPVGPDSLLDTNGVIVYPGTSWNMTPEEVKMVLGLGPEDCLVYVDETYSDGERIYGFDAEGLNLLGVTVDARFVFRAYTDAEHLGLYAVHATLPASQENYDLVYGEICAQLGEQDGGTVPEGYSIHWASDTLTSAFVTEEQWQLYAEQFAFGNDKADPASYLIVYEETEEGLTQVTFNSELPHLLQMAETGALELSDNERLIRSSMALFEKDGPGEWYRSAATSFYDDPAEIHLGRLFADHAAEDALTQAELEALLTEYEQIEIDTLLKLRITVPQMEQVLETYFGVSLVDCDLGTMEHYVYCEETDAYLALAATPTAYDPEFTGSALLENGDVELYYSNPHFEGAKGDSLGAITLRKNGQVWQILSNRLIDPSEMDHSQPIGPGEGLTEVQIGQVNDAFEPMLIVDGGDVVEVNPIHPFFLTYYDDVRDIDLQVFLRYSTLGEEADEEEFQLLRKLENFSFRNCATLADMPVPLHRYPAAEVDRLLRKYTGYGLTDLYEKERVWSELYYLAETDCYYNTTSDACFGTFACTGGYVYDGGIVELYSDHAILTLRQEAGKYYIYSHRKLEAGTALTDEQIQQVRDAFAIVDGEGNINPLASMVNQYYTSPENIDLEALLAYFPTDGGGTEEEYALLQAAYPDAFPEWPTLKDCPLPMHRYNADTVDGVLRKFANITLEDLEEKTGYYLSETDCYYNFTSDMGLQGFHCTGGTIYGDGVILYSNRSTLALKKLGDGYVIDYHLPLDGQG